MLNFINHQLESKTIMVYYLYTPESKLKKGRWGKGSSIDKDLEKRELSYECKLVQPCKKTGTID